MPSPLIIPKGSRKLFDRLDAIIDGGKAYPIPGGGDGKPGSHLEGLIGLKAGNSDCPDSNCGIEFKYHSGKSLTEKLKGVRGGDGCMVTLFHLDPDKAKGAPSPMIAMVKFYGIPDEEGRLKFYHTVKGKSEILQVVPRKGYLVCRPLKGQGPRIQWEEGRLQTTANNKLRRLVMVYGVVRGHSRDPSRTVTYTDYEFLDEVCKPDQFLSLVYSGVVALDFDVHEKRPGSAILRNRGVKFRIPLVNAPDIWSYIGHR